MINLLISLNFFCCILWRLSLQNFIRSNFSHRIQHSNAINRIILSITPKLKVANKCVDAHYLHLNLINDFPFFLLRQINVCVKGQTQTKTNKNQNKQILPETDKHNSLPVICIEYKKVKLIVKE